MGYGKVTEGAEFVEDEYDTSYYVIAEQLGKSQLGGLVYVDREPFSIRYYTGRGGGNGVDAILDRSDMLEWHTSGCNIAGYGHPFLIFKVKRAVVGPGLDRKKTRRRMSGAARRMCAMAARRRREVQALGEYSWVLENGDTGESG
jgi:hypothetical protein